MKVQVKKENKSWTHDASRKKRKRKDSHVHKRVKIEREDHAKGFTTNQMIITSTHFGPSVHLTIITMLIIYMVISSTHSGLSIHLTISIISLHMHILI
jgi:hypothetical protein